MKKESDDNEENTIMIPEPRKAVRMPFERSISSGSRKFSISFDLSNGFSLSSEDLRQSKSKVVVVIGSTFLFK